MNKAFEKILEFIDEQIKIEESIAKSENEGHPITHQYGANCMNVIKKFVQEVAEEYNNGYIPCSERLPEDGGYYLVTYHEWSKGNFLPKYNDTYVRRMHYQKSERFTGWNYPVCVDDRAENDTNREVIAWMKLPEVYKN